MKRILDVGNCDLDHGTISRALGTLDAEIVRVHSSAEALQHVQKGGVDLVMVNRILDRDGGSGLDLIREISQQPEAPKTMLISNLKDAQQQATSAGAQPGFGKAESDDAIRERVEASL